MLSVMEEQLALESLSIKVHGDKPSLVGVTAQEVKAVIDYAKNLERVLAEALRLSHGTKERVSV